MAEVLNNINYKQKEWNMVSVGLLCLTNGKFVDLTAVFQTYLCPFVVYLCFFYYFMIL